MKARHVLTLAAVLLSSAACGLGVHAQDRGPTVNRSYAIGAFNRISVGGPYDVVVKSGGAPGVSARGDEALLNDTKVEVIGGELRIVPKDRGGLFNFRSWHHNGKAAFVVNGASQLSGAEIAGSGGIAIDRAATPRFKGDVAGSGGINIGSLQTDSAELTIAGSGDIRAAGKARSLKLNIAGSGNIETPKLQAEDSTISVAGSGNIRAHVTRSAKVTILGSGDVALTGGAKCSVSKHGSGTVNCS